MSKLFGNSTDSPKGWQWLVFPLALVWFALNESRKFLHRVSYNGVSGIISAIFSVFLSFGAIVWSSHSLGWQQGYPAWYWIPGGLFAGWCTYAYIWPLIHLVVIRGVIKLSDLIWEALKFIGRDIYAPVTKFVADAARILPGSSALWDSFKERDRFGNLLAIATAVGTLAFAVWTGLDVWGKAAAVIPGFVPAVLVAWTPTWVVSVLGAACGTIVAVSICSFVFQLLEKGRLDGLAVGFGVAIGYVYAGTITSWLALVGLTGYGAWAGMAVGYVVYLAYLFPAMNKFLSLGVFKKVAEWLSKVNQKTYGDDQGDYSKVFGHLANIGVAGALTWVAWTTCAALGLALYFSLPIMVVVAVTAYLFDKEFLRGNFSVILVALGVSGYGGYEAYNYYLAAGYPFGVFGAAPAAAFSFLASMMIAYPIVYLGVRYVLVAMGVERLRYPLDQLYKKVEDSVRVIADRLEKVYWSAYKDNNDYRDWFVQVVNIALAVAIYLSLTVYLGFGSSVVWIAVAGFLTFCAYAFFGQFLARPADIGLHFAGGIAGIAASAWVGSAVWSVTSTYWIVAVAAVFTWPVVYAFAFPVVYIVLRFLTNVLIASWSRPLLVGLHSFAWTVFDKAIWTPVQAVAKAIGAFLGPLFSFFAAVGNAIKSVYDSLMRILRRN